MKPILRIVPILVLAVFTAGLAACNDEEQHDEAADLARLAKMEADIDDFIGEPTCKDVKDCRAIAFGAKPCGGPWKYKIFSAATVDSLELAGMVDAYNKLNATLNDRHGWMSDCMMVMPPDIDCLDGRCVAVEPPGETPVE